VSEVLEVISSFYLPVMDGKLLLPNVSVAEVVDYQTLENSLSDAPDSYLGTLDWRGMRVPVLSFEKANGHQFEVASNSRIVVINSVTADNTQLPFFGIVTQGIPRLVKITEESIENLTNKLGPAESAQVRVDGEYAVIPNLGFLEALVLPCVNNKA